MARIAAEACVACMPVMPLVGHLTLVNSYGASTTITVFRIQSFKAVATVWLTVAGHVTLATKRPVTLGAHEVLCVPTTTFSLGTFIRENDLEEEKRPSSSALLLFLIFF